MRSCIQRRSEIRTSPFCGLASAVVPKAVALGLALAGWSNPGLGRTPAQADSASELGKQQWISQAVSRLADRHVEGHEGEDGGACVSLPQFSIMFSAGSTAEEVQEVLERQPAEQYGLFLAQGSRWTATATNGAVAQGQPLTLTYSFVPDGTTIPFSGNTAASNLFATVNAGFPGGSAAFRARVRAVFDRYSELTNITYVEVSDDGAAFPASLGVVGARGDIRISMRDLASTALAVNFFPQFGGDMILDSADIATFSGAGSSFRALRNTLSHEHGHGLGLQHVLPQNGTKLMEPVLNLGFDGPQEDDIRGVQQIYGDWAESNEGIGDEEFVGGPLRNASEVGVQVLHVEDVSLERSGGSDFYGFTSFAAVPIAMRLTPIGSTYAFGPENGGSTSTLDAKAVRNLAIRLWRRVSAQTGQLELLAQIDFNQAGQAEYHPPIAYTVAGYMLAEVYSTDGINAAQRYTLDISNSAIVDPATLPSMRVFDGASDLGDDDTVIFGSVNLGSAANRTITVTNAGPGTLNLGPLSIQGPAAGDYSASIIQNQVSAGGTTQIPINFSPTAAGQRVAVVTVPNNDPTRSNFGFIVTGAGVVPPAPAIEVEIDNAVTIANGNFDFGDITIGETRSVSFRIRNTGNANLVISGIQVVGANAAEFSTVQLSANLTAGAAAASAVQATPSAAGLRVADLRILSNAQPSPFVVHLRANGVVPIVDCNGNQIDDADDIAAGASIDCDDNGTPDECQADSDQDGVIDPCDMFPGQDDRLDTDGDGTVDAADGCPTDAGKTAPGTCGCGQPDTDSDADGLADCNDPFPNDPTNGANGNGNANTDGNENANGNGVVDGNGNINTNPGDDNGAQLERELPANPCGFGVFPGLLVSIASLAAGKRGRRVS